MPYDEWLLMPFVLGAVAALVGCVYAFRSYAEPELRRRLREAPRRSLGDGLGKGISTFEGRAFPLDGGVIAPISRKRAVFFRVEVRRAAPGRQQRWKTVLSRQHTGAWLLQEDHGGSAIVDSSVARVIGAPGGCTCSTFREPPPHVEAWYRAEGHDLRAPIGTPWPHAFDEDGIYVGEVVTVSGTLVIAPDGRPTIARPPGSWMVALAGTTVDAYLAVSARRRRIGIRLLVAGVLLAGAAAGTTWLWKQHRIARVRAAETEAARGLVETFEARLRVLAAIEADAAVRPPVLRTDLEPDSSRSPSAFVAPVALLESIVGGDSSGPASPKCQALRGAEPTAALAPELRRCTRDALFAVVRERPPTNGLRFSGDAVVYDLADGEYLGGVALDIADDPDHLPLGYQVERRLRLAVTGSYP